MLDQEVKNSSVQQFQITDMGELCKQPQNQATMRLSFFKEVKSLLKKYR